MVKLKKFLTTTLVIISVMLSFKTTTAQVSLTSSSAVTENFSTFSSPPSGTAVSTLNSPTNWTLTATGNTWRGTSSTTGATGGWYANNNLSFLGSGSASNAQSTWVLQNNTGSTITGFTLSFKGTMFRSGASSPNVTVSWSNAGTSTNPSAGALTNSLSSLTFNDATSGVSIGATLTQTVSSISIATSQYIFIRFIHPGGSSSDNLGWDDVTFTPTIVTPSTISCTGSLSTFTTTYGTASTSQSFSISGTSMTAGITVTPPVGFEVSTSSSFTVVGTNSSPIVVGSSGTISSTTIYVRISATATPGTYNSKNIVLSSTSASNVNATTTASGNTVSTKSLTITGAQAQNKQYDGTTSATITGTLSGIIGSDVVTLVGTGNFISSSVGTGKSVTSTSTLGGANAAYYTLTQPTGLSANITQSTQVITFNTLAYKTTSDTDFTAIVSSTSGLPITLSSSNTSVATILSGKIHIVGFGTSIITASQLGDTNYLAASSVNQSLYVFTVMDKWTFESVTTTNTGTSPTFGISSNVADQGSLTSGSLFTALHSSISSVWSNPVGNGTTKSVSVTNWSVGDYWQFQASTIGYTSLKVMFDQTGSNTGPRDFKLQYSTDGTTFTDFSSYTIAYNTVTSTNIGWSSTTYKSESVLMFDLSSLTLLEEKSMVYFRIVDNSTTSINGTTVGTGGTSRIDNFTLLGNYSHVLPITLVEWYGQSQGTTNKLSWTTATEINNSKFIIERASSELNWQPIVEIPGSGNSFNYKAYSYVDVLPMNGVNYYRLKQVDYDGQFQLSKVISVSSKELLNNTIYYDFQEMIIGRCTIVSNPEYNKVYLKSSNGKIEKVILMK